MKLEELKSFDLQEFFASLSNLDQDNIGSWPLAVKVFIYIIVFSLVLLVGYMFDLKGLREQVAVGQEEQQTLLDQYETKIFKAQNLDTYKQQLKDMEDSFGALLRQLPVDTEVPGLLEDITHTGIGSGLTFDSIDLGVETAKDFYAELPIQISVHGDYHAFGSFVSGVSALPRIVTLHDFKMEPMGSRFKDEGAPVLKMTITAKTYRYNDAQAGNKGKGDKK